MKKRQEERSFHSRLRSLGHLLGQDELYGTKKDRSHLKKLHRTMLRDFYNGRTGPKR